jgi:hypothetical protein
MKTRTLSQKLAVSLCALVGVAVALPAVAGPGPRGDNRSYSNITGTNIWNSTAPILDRTVPVDPALITRIEQFNQTSQAKYKECLDAIAAAEQNAPTVPPRQYLRRDPRVPYPQACVDLDNLRTEADTLKAEVKKYEESAAQFSGVW